MQSGDSLKRFEIACRRGFNHAGWQRWRGSVAVPAASASLRVEIVTEGLLVEARLRSAWRVPVGGPEARAVGGHHLIDERRPALRVAAELEFGVGDDDAAFARDLAAFRI